MADPVVHITNGVPDSGTGNITTLGAVVALLPAALGGGGGLKVDGSGTALPVSGTVTANAGTNLNTSALATESGGNLAATAAVLGTTAGAAVTTSAAGTVQQYLRGIVSLLVSGITVATHAVTQSGSWVLSAGAAIIGKVGIDQTTDGTTNKVAADLRVGGATVDKGPGTGGSATPRFLVDSSQIGPQQTTAQPMATGYTLVAIPSDQVWPKGMSPKGFAAAFTTLTRPANTTAYSAGDSISNNATAASVTALSATVSDTNNDLVTITDILVTSTDTGLAGKRVRAYLFNSDPTASTGTQAGDNATFSQKVAGYIGSFSGVLETGFFDGTVGRLVPSFNDSATSPTPNTPAGGLVVSTPTSGAKTLFVVVQTLDAFTPSANSTTLILTARGFQGRAG